MPLQTLGGFGSNRDHEGRQHNHSDHNKVAPLQRNAAQPWQHSRSKPVGGPDDYLESRTIPDKRVTKRELGESMKLPLPSTRDQAVDGAVDGQPEERVLDILLKQQSLHVQHESTQPGRSVFDDTQSFSLDDSDMAQDEETAILRGPSYTQSWHQTTNNLPTLTDTHPRLRETLQTPQSSWNLPNHSKDAKMQANNLNDGHNQMGTKIHKHLRMSEIATSRQDGDRLQGGAGLDTSGDDLDDDNDSRQLAETPLRAPASRRQPVPPLPPPKVISSTKTVTWQQNSPAPSIADLSREDSPVLEVPKTDNMPARKRAAKPSLKGASESLQVRGSRRSEGLQPESDNHLVQKHMADAQQHLSKVTTTFESSRASDYPSSSEEDVQPSSEPATPSPVVLTETTPTRKRSREEVLDHDLSVLKSMTFAQLNNEVFSEDPRVPTTQTPSFDSKGSQITLSQRLASLSKMQQDDQKMLFRSQSDEEWSQTGTWFMEIFQTDLKRLMDVRLERRKISMRYESEIRRRQKDVEWAITGVEDNLKSLKKGGGELINGREGTAGSRRGTPRK